MEPTRPAAVAGSFYPADPAELANSVDAYLDAAVPLRIDLELRMLVVPHAGHVYSGSIAATAYALVEPGTGARVVLLGPAHHAAFSGMAVPRAMVLSTPLGGVAVDGGLRRVAVGHPRVVEDDRPHRREHCLEVQLPFLQRLDPAGTVLPLLTGDVAPGEAADLLGTLHDADPGALIVISSDLSHYLSYEPAVARDERTAAAIVALRWEDVGFDDACGRTAVQAALLLARERSWRCELLDLRNSADTAGTRDRVVGYGAFVLGPLR
jgi:AmmeMemoRadiSam system protein B